MVTHLLVLSSLASLPTRGRGGTYSSFPLQVNLFNYYNFRSFFGQKIHADKNSLSCVGKKIVIQSRVLPLLLFDASIEITLVERKSLKSESVSPDQSKETAYSLRDLLCL